MSKSRYLKKIDNVHTHKYVLNNNKGITLVALVITIIILLILAEVSIKLVLGKNGLINSAKEARDKIFEQEEIEKVQMAVASFNINKVLNESSLKEELTNNGLEIRENENFFKGNDSYLYFGKVPYQINFNGMIRYENFDYNFFDLSKVVKCYNSAGTASTAYGYIEDDTLVSVMGSYGLQLFWKDGLANYMPIGKYKLSFETYIPNSTTGNKVNCGIYCSKIDQENTKKSDIKTIKIDKKDTWVKINTEVEVRSNQDNYITLQAYGGNKDNYTKQVMRFRNISLTFEHY